VLAPFAARPAVKQVLAALAEGAALAGAAPARVVRGWVHCLATAGLERADLAGFDGGTRVLACGGESIAPHYRAQLLGELIKAGVGSPTQRRDAIVVLVATTDPLRRAAGLDAIPAVWPALAEADQEVLVPAVTRSLAASDVVEVGTAAESAGTLLGRSDLTATVRATLAAALVERAGRESDGGLSGNGDAELAGTLLAAIAAGKVTDGRVACERGVAGRFPVTRAAGRDCLTALAGGIVPDPDRELDEPAPAAVPALELEAVLGHRVTWRLETTRGTVAIRLAPDVAPMHVASVVALTRARFYDGLVFHRVVPDFVVQGGDPTGTGWGGPGYTLPAEPGSRLDGDDYRTGAVGIADAGKDSGGSQWFAMHSRAPHLEGRYTRIGNVVSGQDVLDALVVGDKVITATVTIE
jgi:cyclophilin family peptidyl-prolyl cis-trans isomerase